MIEGFAMLTQSHGVAVLDAATDWRKHWQKNTDWGGTSYSPTFQGWGSGGPPNDVAVEFRIGTFTAPLHVWIFINETTPIKLVRGPPIVSILTGARDIAPSTLLVVDEPYDFIEPGFLTEPGLPVLPATTVDLTARPWVQDIISPLRALKVQGAERVLHVMQPPPRAHPELATHREAFTKALETYAFAPAQQRAKWYSRYSRMLHTELALLDVDVLDAPQAAVKDGLLLDEYAEGLTHGNTKYGVLVAEQIAAWLERGQE